MIRRDFIRWIAVLIVLAILIGGQRAVPQAAGQATAAATPAATMSVGPGSFSLEPRTGLADLSGYQATLRVDFKGKEGGQASQWTETLELLASGKPAARALTATFKGKAPAAASIEPWSAAMNGVF